MQKQNKKIGKNKKCTQILKNSNLNYSNLKTNGTNRKFIIFLKLKAERIKK